MKLTFGSNTALPAFGLNVFFAVCGKVLKISVLFSRVSLKISL